MKTTYVEQNGGNAVAQIKTLKGSLFLFLKMISVLAG